MKASDEAEQRLTVTETTVSGHRFVVVLILCWLFFHLISSLVWLNL